MPSLGQGHQPPFYHQVFSWPEQKPLGPALTLPFEGRTSAVKVCWSADERFVVYTDLVMTSVAVIEVTAASGAAP